VGTPGIRSTTNGTVVDDDDDFVDVGTSVVLAVCLSCSVVVVGGGDIQDMCKRNIVVVAVVVGVPMGAVSIGRFGGRLVLAGIPTGFAEGAKAHARGKLHHDMAVANGWYAVWIVVVKRLRVGRSRSIITFIVRTERIMTDTDAWAILLTLLLLVVVVVVSSLVMMLPDCVQ